jgi:DNA-directed RNA polymerase subunit RPC12/RpoP
MECPNCHKEISGKSCPACGAQVPEESRYCMKCGAPFREEPQQTADQDESFDLDDRILCPDGACTGIIVDGKCTECGKPYPEEGIS